MTSATLPPPMDAASGRVAPSFSPRPMRLHPLSRVLLALAALALGLNLVMPIWRIDLMAPQYPEGLFLQIFHDRFSGDIDKINGLNHYIGMAHIKDEMFPEFGIMRYAFYLLIAWGLITALAGPTARDGRSSSPGCGVMRPSWGRTRSVGTVPGTSSTR